MSEDALTKLKSALMSPERRETIRSGHWFEELVTSLPWRVLLSRHIVLHYYHDAAHSQSFAGEVLVQQMMVSSILPVPARSALLTGWLHADDPHCSSLRMPRSSYHSNGEQKTDLVLYGQEEVAWTAANSTYIREFSTELNRR